MHDPRWQTGFRDFEPVLLPEPGMQVALFDEHMQMFSGWAVLTRHEGDEVSLRATFTQPLNGVAQFYVLWDGFDRLRRFPLDVPMHIRTDKMRIDSVWLDIYSPLPFTEVTAHDDPERA